MLCQCENFHKFFYIMYMHLQTRLKENKFTQLDGSLRWFFHHDGAMVKLFATTDVVPIGAPPNPCPNVGTSWTFLHEQWHFCKAKDCHLAKKKHTHTHTQCKSYKGRFGKLWPKVTIFERDKKTQFAIFKHVTKT
jgi:hypothetical protein